MQLDPKNKEQFTNNGNAYAQNAVDVNNPGGEQAYGHAQAFEQANEQAREGYFTEPGRAYAEKFPPRLKGASRVFWVPLLFMIFHFLAGTITAIIYILIAKKEELRALAQTGGASAQDIFDYLLDPKVTTMATLLMAAVVIPVYGFYIWRRRKKVPRFILQEKVEGKDVLIAALATFGAVGIATLWMLFLQIMQEYLPFIKDKLQAYEKMVGLISSEKSSLLLKILTVVILVPIAEDLLFRGIIMGELLCKVSPARAIWIQALLFAVFHLNVVQSSYTIFPGLALGFCYALSGNLLIPIGMHILFNFMGGIIPELLGPENEVMVLGITGLEILAFVILLVILFKRGKERSKAAWDRA